METVQPILKTFLTNALSEYIDHGRVTINGKVQKFDIYKTIIEGSKIKKYIYIVEEVGTITEANLIDSNGNFLAIKPVNIQKGEDGIIISFEFNLVISEV